MLRAMKNNTKELPKMSDKILIVDDEVEIADLKVGNA